VLQNDTDADGDVLTAVLAGGPSSGTVSLNSDGSFTYSPNAGFTGNDSFTYKANDGKTDSNTATVTITVSARKDTVAVTSATWNKKTKILSVEATSTGAPEAVLTITVPGYPATTMTPVPGTNRYTYTLKTPSKPASVTVTSSLGGSATKTL